VHPFSFILRTSTWKEVEDRVKSDPSLEGDDAVITNVTPARYRYFQSPSWGVLIANRASYIHIDQSEKGALEVLNDNIQPPELAEKLKKVRWAIINVWRPIKPVRRVLSTSPYLFSFCEKGELTVFILGPLGFMRCPNSPRRRPCSRQSLSPAQRQRPQPRLAFGGRRVRGVVLQVSRGPAVVVCRRHAAGRVPGSQMLRLDPGREDCATSAAFSVHGSDQRGQNDEGKRRDPNVSVLGESELRNEE
jgi:hypothetical protein